MSQPKGFVVKGHEHKVCKLLKSLYGIKQAPRAWYEKLTEHLLKLNFKHYDLDDAPLFFKKVSKIVVYLVVYVDDILMRENNESYIASIKKELRKGFEMTDLGYAHYYLGIEVTQHLKSIFVSQKKYIGDLLNRFMQKPCEGHWSTAKRVVKYFKGTQDFGFKYIQVGNFILIRYSDSDFNGDKETGVSTSIYAMSLGSGVVSWRSHKQLVLAYSTTEAEYVATTEATKEILWLEKILKYLQVKQVHSNPLMIDNTSIIKLARNPKFHDRTKHINTKYHLIRNHVEAKTIHLSHFSTNE
eukprot:PITA_28082